MTTSSWANLRHNGSVAAARFARVGGPASGSLPMENPAQDQLLSGAKVAPST